MTGVGTIETRLTPIPLAAQASHFAGHTSTTAYLLRHHRSWWSRTWAERCPTTTSQPRWRPGRSRSRCVPRSPRPGLSLDRIRYRLRQRGVQVSVPTLSNWQAGRRQPERAESLRAVTELEHVLRLPSGTLRSLLGPPKPRGRVTTPTAMWGRAGARLMSTMDTVADARLRWLSQHDTVTVDHTGRLVRVRSRLVLRARQNGADRWIDVWHAGSGAQPATVNTRWHCSIGRVEVDVQARLSAAELVLDLPLARDATAVAEYQLDFPNTGGRAGRTFLPPIHVTGSRVRHGGPVRPDENTGSMPSRKFRKVLVPSRNGSVHLVELDAIGLVELTWDM